MSTDTRLRPEHLLALVDDAGIVQHARGVIPDRSTGYCLDDAARLAIVAVGLKDRLGEACSARLTSIALSFILHAWAPEQQAMRNFMDFSRRWLDVPHRGDHVGRAAWALGTVAAAAPATSRAEICVELLAEMEVCLCLAGSPRQTAFTILGLTRLDSIQLGRLEDPLGTLADQLARLYDRQWRPEWPWFEDVLSYDNGRLPQALIAAGARLNRPDLAQRGLNALAWYGEQCGVATGTIQLVGNRWRKRDDRPLDSCEEGDEQPLDAAALAEALMEAYAYTGDRVYAEQAVRAYEWFIGRNRLGIPVYDVDSGGCRDGLGPDGLNDNEGAESTLAYLQAFLALRNAPLLSDLQPA